MSTFRIRGLETMSFPVVTPVPGRMDKTPGGTRTSDVRLKYVSIKNEDLLPASAASCANSRTVIGAACLQMSE